MWLEEYKQFVLRTDVQTLEEELKVLRRMFKWSCTKDVLS